MYSIESYRQMLYALLPPGTAWSTSSDSNTYKLLTGLAQEFVNIDDAATYLVTESNPLTMILDMIGPRYAEVGLPDDTSDWVSLATQASQKSMVLGRWRAVGGASKVYFLDVLQALGVQATIDDLHEINPPMVCTSLCDTFVNDDYQFSSTWRINYVDPSAMKFTAGVSQAGDSLGSFSDVQAMLRYIEKIKPAHTRIVYQQITTL